MTAGELRGLHLHVDCASGVAGDMMLGALLDLGVPRAVIDEALAAVGAPGRLRVAKRLKAGIAATDVTVDTAGSLHPAPGGRHKHDTEELVEVTEIRAAPTAPETESTLAVRVEDLAKLVERTTADAEPHRHPHTRPRKRAKTEELPDDAPDGEHDHDHHHDHDHDAHAHYHYKDIRIRISASALAANTKQRALDIFDRIARAEATLHGTTFDDVTFHEVGAIDSVVDVVGTAAALAWLAPASVSCASVAMGHGTLRCAHGVLPVPAPAALEILRAAGGVMADGGVARELCTPTGAAILAATVTRWAAAPTGRPVAVGWGAGDADLGDRANVLRVVAIAVGDPAADEVYQIDSNLDDMSPELCTPAADAMFAAGALDVWWTPITMKKGRPALTLSALAPAAARDAVIATMLRETTTIGVRYTRVERRVLARSFVEVATRYGAIAIKIARDGDAIVNAAPEYEACAAAAKTHGVSVKLVYAAALAAFSTV